MIKKLFRQKLSANWHYYIWFVLILRLIIPFASPNSFNVLNFIPQYQQAIDFPQISMPSVQQQEQPTTEIQVKTNNASADQGTIATGKETNTTTQWSPLGVVSEWLIWQISTFIWIIGVLGILTYILLINGLILFKIRKLPVCESELILERLQECQSKLKIRNHVAIVYEDSIKSPAIIGLWHPKIMISPEIVNRLSAKELSYIFLHELSHMKRRDLLINGLVLVLQVIYWFNPIIWYALHQMKQDCEIACDATALAVLKTEEHKKYGKTIISMLQLLSESKWVPGTLGFVSKFNTRRIIMITEYRRTTLKWTVAALALTLVVGCSSLNNPINSQPKAASPTVQQDTTTTPSPINSSSGNANSIVYQNTQYGFSFSLPGDWKGYSIVSSPWQGTSASGGVNVESGPMISIRNPQWTSAAPTQDIPIMIFTIDQWNSLQQDVFHIGAAPINPSELGRNNTYVFALPARYNYAFPKGYQEVETILKGSPFQTTSVTQQHPDSTESLLSNMMISGKQGKVVFNNDFAAKTNTIEDIEKVWGKPDKTDWVSSLDESYNTYSSHSLVFGVNKGDQITEVRSYDSRLKGITLAQAKEVLGRPVYDNKSKGQEIIGYTTGTEFKIELVFPQITQDNPNPVLDHYNVLYPQGTVNSMANYPGRQW